MSDELLHDLVDQLRNRYYGKYRGVVVEVDAPHMRVKATVPGVLADAEVWCMPCVPYAGPSAGFCFLPDVGAGVWIEFERGDVEFPIWTGCYWFQDEIPDDAKPAVRVIVTASGSKLIFDDDAGEIRLEDANGASIVFDSSGVTTKRDSSSVAVSSSSVSVNDGALEVS
ncbi:phage baseplate assembly protein V [Microbacterium deminutum]|uniref:Phage baseplate assembly protein V n=1 Tax=Microbacterium deminutum TaxID=344164 RepID=A0ABN2QN90_9MICO